MRKLRMWFRVPVIAVMIAWMCSSAALAAPADGYVIEKAGYRIPIPLGYSVERVLASDYQHGALKTPEDLFIDKKDNLYIVDTGNDRIVKMDKFGNILKVFGKGENDVEFYGPRGIFVEDDGDLYVADTGNSKIVHLSAEGELIEEFVAPESELIDKDFPFTPTKLVLDRGGNMYVQSGNDYHGLMVIDGHNTFQGYIAPNKLPFNLKDWILRTYATKEQREALGKIVPPNHRNVTIDLENGYLYTAIENTKQDEIKRFNFLGINTYPSWHYGEISFRRGILTTGNIVDLAIDKNGIITAVDSNHRKVYQFDQEGNNLLVFGGNGDQTGFFQEPVSVAVDSEGLVYVLDRLRGQIQVFRANDFTELVHVGSRLFHEGRYEEALKPWNEVLAINSNYNLAHRGVGKALYKEGQWLEAMKQFRLGEDTSNYSKAFKEYRHDVLRHQFGWVVLIATVILVALYFTIVKLHQYSKRLEFASHGRPQIENVVLTLFSPREAFSRIQSNPSLIAAAVLIAAFIGARFFEIYVTSFHFAYTRPEFANLVEETAKLLVPFFAWVVSAWSITSIMDGESKPKQILVASSFAMLPYIIGTVSKTLMSNILTHDELGLWNAISTGVYWWMALMLFFMIMSMNDYTAGRTIWVIVVTIFTMIALLAIGILFYVLVGHVISFFRELFLELYIRSY
ncbi:YIP1 family protein [Paenibacillus thermotolerans]|uniref:YIP1 family protein n=1 Tax=Paenibacillus thermotolerans TaxID=3027807 RepID=UPI002367B5EE|nr:MULTISPECIES: YIP1 family protein [unclassified Paenibacillus]